MTKRQDLITETLSVIQDYTTKLTLRQIYYRLVTRGVLKNQMSEYKALSEALVEGRLSGAVSWNSIEDRTRDFSAGDRSYIPGVDLAQTLLMRLSNCGRNYQLPLYWGQSVLVEVWAEKQALESLFSQVCREKGVTLGVCRGYPSITYLHDAAERIQNKLENAIYERSCEIEKVVILYFGDHDPSGRDIERNITSRLTDTFDLSLDVRRIAITEEQITKYNIPPMPTKTKDSRAAAHIAKYGAISSVELDALDPAILQSMISASIDDVFDSDPDIQKQRMDDTEQEKENIENFLDHTLKGRSKNDDK